MCSFHPILRGYLPSVLFMAADVDLDPLTGGSICQVSLLWSHRAPTQAMLYFWKEVTLHLRSGVLDPLSLRAECLCKLFRILCRGDLSLSPIYEYIQWSVYIPMDLWIFILYSSLLSNIAMSQIIPPVAPRGSSGCSRALCSCTPSVWLFFCLSTFLPFCQYKVHFVSFLPQS